MLNAKVMKNWFNIFLHFFKLPSKIFEVTLSLVTKQTLLSLNLSIPVLLILSSYKYA